MSPKLRTPLTVAALFAVGCGSVLAYSWGTRGKPVALATAPPAIVAPSPQHAETSGATPPPHMAPPPSATTTPEEKFAKLAAEAEGEDPVARATAIDALSAGPRSRAIPILKKVLEYGQTTQDRHLALQSLRKLAQEHGDGDGVIRAAVRHVIYHGSDDDLVRAARDTLETLEPG